MPTREIYIVDGVAHVPLTKGYVAMVDTCDLKTVAGHNWVAMVARNTVYAYTRLKGGKRVFMHRLLLSAPNGAIVDHSDMDGLNNKRENIRLSTRSQNAYNQPLLERNTSGYKGVCWHKGAGKWMARISADGNHKYLGLFDDPKKAHDAYCQAAKDAHGEFARVV